MEILDWLVILAFFGVLIGIGFWSYRKIKRSSDFYVGGGKIPWWLAGISHHVSGYSGVVFTSYAAVAYAYGLTLYFFWAVPIAFMVFLGAYLIAPRWVMLRKAFGIQSATEYLKIRYNLPTQQLFAWCGVILKLLDVAGKYAAIGVLLNAFSGIPVLSGIIIAGVATMIYVTIGGLWADIVNDFFQFTIQVIAGIAMFFIILAKLNEDGINYINMWNILPKDHSQLFNGPYTAFFVMGNTLVIFFSYLGGTWNLASRFISQPSIKSAQRTAVLSSMLYLIWPLIMFAPLWAAPLLFPDFPKDQLNQVYAKMTIGYLPAGLVGMVLASMFAATLSMIASDSNAISAVITRDILPVIRKFFYGGKTEKGNIETPLAIARVTTLLFTILTIIIALNRDYFGGIMGLIIRWFGGLLGPTAIPMVLGLLPCYRHAGSKTAWCTTLAGLATFALVNYGVPTLYGLDEAPLALSTGAPILVALIIYLSAALLKLEKIPHATEEFFSTLRDTKNSDGKTLL